MGDEDEHELVDNPQRAWLETAKGKVAPAAEALRTCLDDGATALTGGAWTGDKGDAWGVELTGRRDHLRTKAQSILDDLDHEISAKPRQVCRCQVSAGISFPTPFDYGGGGGPLSGAAYPSVAAFCTE